MTVCETVLPCHTLPIPVSVCTTLQKARFTSELVLVGLVCKIYSFDYTEAGDRKEAGQLCRRRPFSLQSIKHKALLLMTKALALCGNTDSLKLDRFILFCFVLCCLVNGNGNGNGSANAQMAQAGSLSPSSLLAGPAAAIVLAAATDRKASSSWRLRCKRWEGLAGVSLALLLLCVVLLCCFRQWLHAAAGSEDLVFLPVAALSTQIMRKKN